MWIDNGETAPYPAPESVGTGVANPSARSWQEVLTQGFSTAANVYLLREQAKIGAHSQTQGGVAQSAKAVAPAAAPVASTGTIAGVPPWVILAAVGAVVAVVVLRKG